MKKRKKVIDEGLANISERLMNVRGAIEGVGGLCFTYGGDLSLEMSEIRGLGLLLKMLNSELLKAERTIDQMALDLCKIKELKRKKELN